MSDLNKAVISTVPSRFGQITLILSITARPTVLAAGFGLTKALVGRLKTTRKEVELTKSAAPKEVIAIFNRWSDGDLTAFTGLNLDQVGSKFRQECWKAMLRIPIGKTLSYAELADRTSSPYAIRAAASACANNLIAPIIPCHRIIRSDGTLGNYGYGEKLKLKLLEFEGVTP